jgi:hypothetical protein
MLQMGSFSSLNNPETSNIKPETIKFSYLKISLILDIRLEPQYDIHSLFHMNTRDITERFWCRKTGVFLQLIYGTSRRQPIHNRYVALRNLKAAYLRKGENIQVTTLSFLGTKQISAPTVRCTSTNNMYRCGNNEHLSIAVQLSLATVTPRHAEHGGPLCCVCNMAVYLDSDSRHTVRQCGRSDFSAIIKQSGKLCNLRTMFVFAEVQLRTMLFHHMTLQQ